MSTVSTGEGLIFFEIFRFRICFSFYSVFERNLFADLIKEDYPDSYDSYYVRGLSDNIPYRRKRHRIKCHTQFDESYLKEVYYKDYRFKDHWKLNASYLFIQRSQNWCDKLGFKRVKVCGNEFGLEKRFLLW